MAYSSGIARPPSGVFRDNYYEPEQPIKIQSPREIELEKSKNRYDDSIYVPVGSD